MSGDKTMNRAVHGRVCVWLVASGLGIAAGAAQGAGFALIEQGVAELGNAFAGAGAVAESPSTVFFNPAGISRVGSTLALGFHVISPKAEFTSATGASGPDAGETKVVPNFYYTRLLNDQWSFGLGLTSPFGLSTSYDQSWAGRLQAVDSSLETVSLNPSLSYRVNEWVSVGAGVSAQYVKGELTTLVTKLKGDDTGYGYNLGVLIQPQEDTRIGLAYRSKVEHTLEGTLDVYYPTNRHMDVTLDVALPDTLSLSLYHRFEPRWAVLADVTWTNWSLFNKLETKLAANGMSVNTQPENWKDSLRYSLGLTYYLDSAWTLRGGVAYDNSPIPDATFRTPRIPDADRRWLALGAGYKFSNSLSVDAGYAHLFVNETPIVTPAGHYDSSINIFSAQVTYRFP